MRAHSHVFPHYSGLYHDIIAKQMHVGQSQIEISGVGSK